MSDIVLRLTRAGTILVALLIIICASQHSMRQCSMVSGAAPHIGQTLSAKMFLLFKKAFTATIWWEINQVRFLVSGEKGSFESECHKANLFTGSQILSISEAIEIFEIIAV